MNKKFAFALPFTLLFALAVIVSCKTSSYEKISDGMIVHIPKTDSIAAQSIRLQVVTNSIIHVTSVPGNDFPDEKSLMVLDTLTSRAAFSIAEKGDTVVLKTALLNAMVLTATGQVIFTDTAGNVLLAEKQGGGKTFETVKIDNKEYLAVGQKFESPADEALYGLGANQTDYLNLKGKDADLFQYNTQAVVPFLISTRNYGLLWDNNSRTRYGDSREYAEISALKVYDKQGTEGGLTAIYTDRKDADKVFTTRTEKEINYQFIPDLVKFPKDFKLGEGAVSWEGALESDVSGMHKFIFTSAGYAKLWVDGKLIFDRWRQCWNPSSNRFDYPMEAGKKYSVKIEWIPDGGESYISLKYLPPLTSEEQNRISLFSEVATQINYYFIAGTDMDAVISGYRTITGKAPVMPKWAMGFWQSRERYKTQDEILSTVSEFRKRQIPLDNIVLDWQYWPIDKWGDHDFEASRFPDPKGMMNTLHDSLNARLMISVWAKYYKGTANYEEMDKHGWLYKLNIEKDRKDWLGYVSTFYDAYNADARKAFWDQINTKIFSKGVDGWWLDATEPDVTSNLPFDERKALMNPTALGPAAQYFNAFSLMQASAVYDGQRKQNPDQRVYILTRSAFAGLQRYSAANWSGDVASRWHDMKSQIPCGLSFCISGIPYWTMDIGGFSVETRYNDAKGKDLDEWRELMTRWFQFGTFAPIFRSHGQFPFREMYNIAPENHPAYQSMLAYDKLRYRLMPYIYSLSGLTWLNDYTIMRALVMDFGSDVTTHDIKDQYMFGPMLMINPVYEFNARSRSVYLPAKTGWYDFFTGKHYDGGQTINAAAPYTNIPVFVKDGAILPVGPEIQFTTQKPADPITLFVFSGHNGEFTLYEDENTNYNYEKGDFSLIPFTYNHDTETLTIGERKGEFAGMLKQRTFKVVFVTPEAPGKLKFDGTPDHTITYNGSAQTIKL